MLVGLSKLRSANGLGRWTIFALAVAAWLASFSALRHVGTWTAFAVVGPALAILSLSLNREARVLLRPSTQRVAIGLLAGGSMVAATQVAFAAVSWLLPETRTATVALYDLLNVSGFSPGIRTELIIVVATSEEILFRGALAGPIAGSGDGETNFLPKASAIARVILLAAIYATAALPLGSLLLVVCAFGCALVWGTLRFATRSLVPPILAHVAWDLGVLVVWPLV